MDMPPAKSLPKGDCITLSQADARGGDLTLVWGGLYLPKSLNISSARTASQIAAARGRVGDCAGRFAAVPRRARIP